MSEVLSFLDGVMEKLPPLPEIAQDRFGYPVDLRGSVWRLNIVGTQHNGLDWTSVKNIGPDVLHAFKHYVAASIARHAPVNTENVFDRFKRVLKWMPQGIPSMAAINSDLCYQARNRCRDNGLEYEFAEFRSWYCWLADMDFPGASYELAIELRSWTVPGNTKGEAVLSWDVDAGPLTHEEFVALNVALAEDESEEATLVCVFLEIGCNPRNVCFLEERDLHEFGIGDHVEFQLDVIRIKKRNDRRDTKRRAISKRLGRGLKSLILKNQEALGGPDPHRPIFRSSAPSRDLPLPLLERFRFHRTANDVGQAVREYAFKKQIPNREDGFLRLSPRRLRYTFATRLAEAGAAPMTLAELLDHTDLQHVMVYYKASPKIADRLEQALSHGVGHIWRKFRGEVVKTQTPDLETLFGGTTNAPDVGGIGNCASKGACHKSVPYSCYVCPSFQAWKDGPHQKLLDGLLAERERHIAMGANNESNRIPHQNSQIISAVQELVDQLKREGT